MTLSPALSARPRVLACFDLREQAADVGRSDHSEGFLINCRRVLAHARENGWVVVHIHPRGDLWRGAAPSVHGLEPLPSEPVFVQSGLSAFSSRAFRDLIGRYAQGELVIIGRSSASSCLTTALAAYDHGLQVSLIEDAVGSTALEAQGLEAVGALSQSLQAPFVQLGRTSDLLGEHRRLRLVHSR